MRIPPDNDARRRALTDLGASLLVEAGAGTGKTSLLAGRVAMLLASGVAPEAISAITFTELAAAELGQRIRHTVRELLDGNVPPAMRYALPTGLSEGAEASLRYASERLDGLRTATIHGFCQDLIRGYAVEADVDPGAQVADGDTADIAFDRVFDAWLRRRLDAVDGAHDAISVLARDDPRRMEITLRKLANLRRKHRSARPPAASLDGRPDLELVETIAEYRRWADSAPAEAVTLARVTEVEKLASFYSGSFEPVPDFARLWELAHPPRVDGMRKNSLELIKPKRLTAWRAIAGFEKGEELNAESLHHHERVTDAFAELLGRIGGALVAALSSELDEVLGDYESYKRSAALLDFDDLLDAACRLLRSHEEVRAELSARHRHILVDEFQDTDPVQCDIIFRLTTDDPRTEWTQITPRAGALFAVGDPKQAIYQFRGAHVGTYEAAKATFMRAWSDNLVMITANFRSRQGILAHVNRAFSTPLAAQGQPGHVDLDWIRADSSTGPSAARMSVLCSPTEHRKGRQDAEADAVAAACRKLIGTSIVVDDGSSRLIEPSDIALLAPTGTDLWRYERALRIARVPFASHAGKALLRRQEAQDFLTLARVLADGRDTLAFGALMRGPLVGLTDEELLDISEALPEPAFGSARFTIFTNSEDVGHADAKMALKTLQALRRQTGSTTPAQIMTHALETMNVRAILEHRDHRNAAAAEANLDALLERSRRYAVRGLRAFASDLDAEWRAETRMKEGRPDGEGACVEIMPVHSAKGLEWPIVIPINSSVGFAPREALVHTPVDDTLHWMLGDVAPSRLAAAIQAESESFARERVRLWYVACTRARDLLILPFLEGAGAATWAGAVDLLIEEMPEIGWQAIGGPKAKPSAPVVNRQDVNTFALEARMIAELSRPIAWVRPSDHDRDRRPELELVAENAYETGEVAAPVAGSRVRGLLLHKLLEEIIEEGLPEDQSVLAQRAEVLMREVELLRGETTLSADLVEIAALALRTLAIPQVALLRPRLRAEVPINSTVDTGEPMAGRADAVATGQDGHIDVVIDWKSDVAPSPADFQQHADQVRLYLKAIGAERGLVVYASVGLVRSVGLGSNATEEGA